MKERALNKALYKRAMEVFSELCEWCDKLNSMDCSSCEIEKARCVVAMRKLEDKE